MRKTVLIVFSILICQLGKTQNTTQPIVSSNEIPVSGACVMCKKRIESAVYTLTGIKKATWSVETHLLTVDFDASKTSLDAIKQKIALLGHDAPPFKTEDALYKKLPPCCKYRDKNKATCTME